MFLKFLLLVLFKNLNECPNEGIFSIPNTGCKSYKICSQLGASNYSCPSTTLFDQRAQKCVLDFVCPDTICAQVPAGLYPDPNYPSNKKFYIECYGVENFNVRYGECIDGQIFQSDSGKCDKEEIATTTSAPLIPISNCSVSGSIIPIFNTNCEKYGICDNFALEIFNCPITTFFDPWTNKCRTDYKCLEKYCLNEPEDIYYLDPNDSDKKRYFECLRTVKGVLPSYRWCGDDAFFDEEEKTCISSSSSTPNCTSYGIFPVYWKVTNCTQYGICSNSVLETYQCPNMTFFDPFESECSHHHQCLEIYCYNNPENIYYLDPNDPIQKRYYACIWDEKGLLQLYYWCGDDEVFNDDTICVDADVACTREGILPTNRSNEFRICFKSETSLVLRTYKCAILTYFDPWKSQCVSDFIWINDYCEFQPKNVFYLDPNDSEKKRFYQCVWYNTTLRERVIPLYYSCGDDEIFDEINKRCITTTTLVASTSDCSVVGSTFPVYYTNCLEYKICFKSEFSFDLKTYRCPGLTLFDPFKGGCVFDYTCIENYCFDQLENVFYLDPNDLEKRRFYECIWDEMGVFPKYYSCEIGEVFDEVNQKCAPIPSPKLIQPISDCYKEGLFPEPYSDCKIFKICRVDGKSYLEEKYYCPTMEFFNPWKSECDSDYECLENTCLDKPEGTLFLDRNDPDKKRYYQCVWDGFRISPLYHFCNDGNIFVEEKEMCVENIGFMTWMWMALKKLFG
nr:uncharacterized protein LOC111413289 [Onthophagus taurus]